MLHSVDGYDEPDYRDRGDSSSSDESFICDAASRIRLDGRDAVLADAM